MLKRKSVIKGDTLYYSISASGFDTITNEVIVSENTSIEIKMQQEVKNDEYELIIDGITNSNYVGVVR